jgi:hypothetical protein
MQFRARIPRVVSSSIETGPTREGPIFDGSEHVVPNNWKIPPNSVALIGRPAVWVAFDIQTPRIGPIPPLRWRGEQDFGGHLFLAVVESDDTKVTLIEAGPTKSGAGALVPYRYPEDDFAKRKIVDFEPIIIAPPNGMHEKFFAGLVKRTQREYDGDQAYLAIEIPFLRVGRDSNSYAVGVLLACGVDPRAIPKPKRALRFEIAGYPGAEDPVHRANFGAYLGVPHRLADGTLSVPYHNSDGGVRLVGIGGEAHGTAQLPDGTIVALDNFGRRMLAPDTAARHGLPVRHTEPPKQITERRHFPPDPAPQGAVITLVVGDRAVPLEPGDDYTGTIVERDDALGLAFLRQTDGVIVVLPLTELGVELRDPKRLDALLRIGTTLTVGLHSDRHPKIVVQGDAALTDAATWHRPHLPTFGIPMHLRPLAAIGALLLAAAGTTLAVLRRRTA